MPRFMSFLCYANFGLCVFSMFVFVSLLMPDYFYPFVLWIMVGWAVSIVLLILSVVLRNKVNFVKHASISFGLTMLLYSMILTPVANVFGIE